MLFLFHLPLHIQLLKDLHTKRLSRLQVHIRILLTSCHYCLFWIYDIIISVMFYVFFHRDLIHLLLSVKAFKNTVLRHADEKLPTNGLNCYQQQSLTHCGL